MGTLCTVKIYKELASHSDMTFHGDNTDWNGVLRVYGPHFRVEIRSLNSPTVTAETTPERLRENWPEICRLVREELPSYQELLDLVRRAGAPETVGDISVSAELGALGLRYHPYMRHRMTLMRLIPMMDVAVDYESVIRG